MGEEISSRMKPESDLEYRFPILDCPICGQEDIPFGMAGPYIVNGLPITLLYCLNCNQVLPPQVLEEKVKPKGYVSDLDLEEFGYTDNL